MSRNRPRNGPTNHVQQEELNIWQQLISDASKAKELNDKQKELGQQIIVMNEKITKDGNSESHTVQHGVVLYSSLHQLVSTIA